MSTQECKCQYCGVELSCHSSLLRHQKHADKCKKAQKEYKTQLEIDNKVKIQYETV
jgi:hypothetical protein